MTRTQGLGDLYRIYLNAERDGMDFNLTYIPPSFDVPHEEEFDTHYRRELYALGRQAGLSGKAWEKEPPGFDSERATVPRN